MKTATLLTVLGLIAGTLAAAPTPPVAVKFVDTDNFTDFTDSYSFPDRGRGTFIKELTAFIQRKATARLAPGQSLEVVITDVDMAGEFEPWRGPNAMDVRIVKDLYPPRINLSFRIVGASGAVIAEGDRKLRDLGFMYTVRPTDQDPLRYEKDLLDRWLARELRAGEAI